MGHGYAVEKPKQMGSVKFLLWVSKFLYFYYIILCKHYIIYIFCVAFLYSIHYILFNEDKELVSVIQCLDRSEVFSQLAGTALI